MFQQTLKKPVLYKRTLTSVVLGVLSVATILYGGLSLRPQTALAATASTINFQARLEGPGGNIAADGYYNIQFKLYSASSGGSALWTEDYYDSNGVTAGNDNRVQVINGYVSVPLGSQTAFPGTINWDQNLYLTMNVGGTTQTATPTYDGEMNPRLALTSVPYAFRAGQLAQLNGANTSTLSFGTQTAANSILLPDASGTLCIQSSTSCGFAASTGSTGYIQNQNASAQATSNFWISGTGIANVLQAGTLDTPSGTTTLNIGTTNATAINLNKDVTVAAGKYISLVGGITSTRPASPTEGMLYYDTTTKQLLVYANGKWQADRAEATKIVADGSTSQNPEAADYVVPAAATNAEVTINSAITALPAGGGTVFLREGTYTIGASISVPSNVRLMGTGDSTIIKLASGVSTNFAAISNANVGTGNNAITISALKLDGNKASVTGSVNAIKFIKVGSGSGATAVIGGLIENVTATNFTNDAITLSISNNNTIRSNNVNGDSANGINLNASSYNSLSGNYVTNNVGKGMNVSSSTNNVISGNNISGNTNNGVSLISSSDNNQFATNMIVSNGGHGISISNSIQNILTGNNSISNSTSGYYITATSDSTTLTGNVAKANSNTGMTIQSTNTLVSNNTVVSNTLSGIFVDNTGNLITNNKLSDNGGSGANDGIRIASTAINALITGNDITDTAGTGYAINLTSGSSGTTLTANRYSGTGATSISDSGTGTIYVNQLDPNGKLISKGNAAYGFETSAPTSTLSIQGGLSTIALPTPAAPTIANVGTAGSTTYRYQVTALDGTGGETLASSVGQTTTGNATLSGTNYNTVTWTAVPGAYQYKIYRCSGAACTPLGLATVASNLLTYSDQAAGSPSGALPTVNTTGGGQFAGALQGTSATLSGASSLTLGTASSNTGSVTFNNSSNANTVAIVSGVTTASYSLVLPTAIGSAGQCLAVSSIASTTANLGYATCSGGSSTLQSDYTASTGGSTAEIVLDSTRNGLTVRNAPSDTISGNLLEIQNNAGTATFLGVSNSAVSLQDTSGNNAFVFDSSTSTLKVYENVTSPTNYASITYSGGAAIFSASSGTTQIGSGSGNVTSNLTGQNDVFSFSKTYTAGANYTNNDFTIQRAVTGGTNTLTGSVLKIEDISSATTASNIQPSVLLVNQSNSSATGFLFNAQSAGVSKVTIANSGAVNIVSSATAGSFASNTYDGSAGLTVGASSATSITIGRSAITTGIVGTIQLGPDSSNNMTISSTTGEPTLNGNARHTRKISLSAEYAGASMTADGSSNTGTMTSDNQTSSPFRNFYKWANTQGTAQDYDIWVKIPLPSDFAAMPSGQTICIDTYASALTANGVKVAVYDTGNTVIGTTFDLTPTGAINTWENKCTTSITAGTFTAGSTITLDIKMTAPATSGIIQIGDITLSYLSKW